MLEEKILIKSPKYLYNTNRKEASTWGGGGGQNITGQPGLKLRRTVMMIIKFTN